MKKLWGLALIIIVYIAAYFISPGPEDAVKNIRLASILKFTFPTDHAHDEEKFNESLKKFAASTNSNIENSLSEMLRNNRFVKNIKIEQAKLAKNDAMVHLSYELEDGYLIDVAFLTNQKRFVPTEFSAEGIVSSIYSKNPVPIGLKVRKNGVELGYKSPGGDHPADLSFDDKLLIQLLGQIFQNDNQKIYDIPRKLSNVTAKKGAVENEAVNKGNDTTQNPSVIPKGERLSDAAKKAISEGFVDIKDPVVKSCTESKIQVIRKDVGANAVINYEVFNEAAVSCGFNIL